MRERAYPQRLSGLCMSIADMASFDMLHRGAAHWEFQIALALDVSILQQYYLDRCR